MKRIAVITGASSGMGRRFAETVDTFGRFDEIWVIARHEAALEGLVGQIDGLLALQLQIDPLPSSNADMLLVATLDSVESLQGYQKSPLHNAVADRYVRPYTAQRLCLDYEE